MKYLLTISALCICQLILVGNAARAFPTTLAIPQTTSAPAVGAAPLLSGIPREECFPLERLPISLRPHAEKILLTLLDGEGLYTVIGAVKPMSSGFEEFRLRVDKADPDGINRIEEARQILATFRCSNEISADLLPFHQPYEGTRFFDAVIFGRTAVQRMVYQYPEFWAPYGVTPTTTPLSLAQSIENDPTTARNRGLGYLYGYPKYAVDFFVASADEQGNTKKLVPRDFVNLPTFSGTKGQFTYAVPKSHTETEEDRLLREKVTRILSAYRERRARYIGTGKPGVVALLRDWFDDGSGRCSPQNAHY